MKKGCDTCKWKMSPEEWQAGEHRGEEIPCEDCKRNPTMVDRYEEKD